MKTSNLEVEDDGFVKHFLAPLRRPQVITNALLVSIFVAGALACLDIRLTNHAIALQNAGSIETVFLAAELNGEAGPDFVRERAMFAGLLSKYAQRMEKRAPRTIFVGQLREAAAILAAPAPRQEGSSNAIRRAAALLTCAARSGINEARGVKAPEAASISFSAEIVKE